MGFMKKQGIGALALGVAAAFGLSACGGGDGSPGVTSESYRIALRADDTSLPSFENQGPLGPYSTILYVSATEGDRVITGGEDVFGCRVEEGLKIGSLFYLDAEGDHVDEDDKIKLYRSITLGANTGGDAFGLVAGGDGTVTVTCSITDPRDGRSRTASVDVEVSG